MNSRLTLLFLCGEVQLYAGFISEFQSANIQMLIARNLAHAKSVLLNRPVDAIVLRHDGNQDDRPLAAHMKQITPCVPVFLLTEEAQPPFADIDSVWRAETGDPVISRAMAIFFRHLLTGSKAARPGDRLFGEADISFNRLGPRSVS